MKNLVLLSGGLDSLVSLALALQEEEITETVTFSYGQRNRQEIKFAKDQVVYYKYKGYEIRSEIVYLPQSLWPSKDVPLLDKESENGLENPSDAVVPFRNGIFIAIAAARAVAHGCGAIYTGMYNEPTAPFQFPDESSGFLDMMNEAVKTGTPNVVLRNPLTGMTKAGVVHLGQELAVPFELSWTCWQAGDFPCERCAACAKREKAFRTAGIQDPGLGVSVYDARRQSQPPTSSV